MGRLEAFAATYALLRASDGRGGENRVVAELLGKSSPEVAAAVALAVRAVARRDLARIERWESWSREDPVRCRALARFGEVLCPSTAGLDCPADSLDSLTLGGERPKRIQACLEESSATLPSELAQLTGY